MKFRVKEYVTDYIKIEDDWQNVEVVKHYEMHTWDDLQSLLCTLIDFGSKTLKFEVTKIEEAGDE